MRTVCSDTGWHGQRLETACPRCGARELVVDQHFRRIVCFVCWAIVERW